LGFGALGFGALGVGVWGFGLLLGVGVWTQNSMGGRGVEKRRQKTAAAADKCGKSGVEKSGGKSGKKAAA
jgi:hypothetical protein